MKKNLLVRTNLFICAILLVGFALTAALSYQANYSASLLNAEQVSTLSAEGIYYQLSGAFTKPLNVSLTMANDSLLKELLSQEKERPEDAAFLKSLQEYLSAYREKYGYDSVFLVSEATKAYYNFHGFDRTLVPDDPENTWYYGLRDSAEEYELVVDNDQVSGAKNEITVFVNCKIRGEDGSLLGVVGVGLRVSDLQQLLQSYETEFQVNACLIDPQGEIEISAQHTGYETVDFFQSRGYSEDTRKDILDWKKEGESAEFWVESAAGASYVVARYLPELEWTLLVERDLQPLEDQITWQMVETGCIIGAIILLILLVVTYVFHSFNRKIVALTQSMQEERHTMFEKATGELYENIYELDITHNCSANADTEAYFESLGAPSGTPYDKALRIIAEKQIKEEFRKGYLETFSPKNVLRAYQQGKDSLRYEFMISTDGVNYYWMRIITRMVKWESDGALHMLVYRQNIDAEKRQEKRMMELAETDEMTGLYTRAAAQRQIERCLGEDPETLRAFFLFDIDHFKEANDLYGHAFGDEVILRFVEILRENFRRDDILGRLGGDEFLAFLPVPDEGWVREQAAVLSRALDQTYERDGKRWHMTASIGVAFAPRDASGFGELYRKADRALYRTKKAGRNSFTLFSGEDGSLDKA